MSKIVFITGHNWDTKRQGGFHKFAEASAEAGIDTVFFSFPRPYYGLFMKREQISAAIIRKLSRGARYETAPGRFITNCTYPTFRLPDAAGKILPDRVMNYMLVSSFIPFRLFAKKFLSGASCFVFESCDGIALLPKIRKFFPGARIIYRPSDPLVFNSVPERIKTLERSMLYTADLSLIVNKEGEKAYSESVPEFSTRVRYEILSNGIDIRSYTKKYPVPVPMAGKKCVLYVGAWAVEWLLVFQAAQETPDLTYIVVCPNYPSGDIQKKALASPNVVYVPGISPAEVPAWITNCTVVMVPYVTDFYKDRPLGITAKYYQAMAAHKPIVAYCDTPKLSDAGAVVTYTYGDFIAEVKKAVNEPYKTYDFSLEGRDWNLVTKSFLEKTGLV